MKDYIVRTIKRKKKDMYTYEYRNKENRLVSQKVLTESLKDLYLPPALDNVKISRNKRDKVLAIGYDTKNRAQYTYNKKFTEKQSKDKFQHMITYPSTALMSQLLSLCHCNQIVATGNIRPFTPVKSPSTR